LFAVGRRPKCNTRVLGKRCHLQIQLQFVPGADLRELFKSYNVPLQVPALIGGYYAGLPSLPAEEHMQKTKSGESG